MRDVSIRDYIGYSKELTAEQVKAMPSGAEIIVHSFDRYGVHQTMEMIVAQSGKKKILVSRNLYGDRITKQIRPATDRMCYTEAKHDD